MKLGLICVRVKHMHSHNLCIRSFFHVQVFLFVNHQFAKTPLGPPLVKVLGPTEPYTPPVVLDGQQLPTHLRDSYRRFKDIVSAKYTFLRDDFDSIDVFLWIGCNVRHCLEDGGAQADPAFNMSPVLTADSRRVIHDLN